MKQQIMHNWQHSPSETQVASNPVKAVSKPLQQTKPDPFSIEDLMGLSWILFEDNAKISKSFLVPRNQIVYNSRTCQVEEEKGQNDIKKTKKNKHLKSGIISREIYSSSHLGHTEKSKKINEVDFLHEDNSIKGNLVVNQIKLRRNSQKLKRGL